MFGYILGSGIWDFLGSIGMYWDFFFLFKYLSLTISDNYNMDSVDSTDKGIDNSSNLDMYWEVEEVFVLAVVVTVDVDLLFPLVLLA